MTRAPSAAHDKPPGPAPPDAPGVVRRRITVRGTVQGVGFRPFVHGLAQELGLSGHVGNTADGVVAEVEGDAAGVETFLGRLITHAPPPASLASVTHRRVPALGSQGFTIRPSRPGRGHTRLPPDTAVCAPCLRELTDPRDRRYRHPFITCTHCGPRFTIVTALPYDRATTTMAAFPLCARCAGEYADPGDRRFHAQPVACPGCGPRLRLAHCGPPREGDAAVAGARELLARGAIVAVKGLGGYHLACDATDPAVVARLRAAKERDGKPFAVMAADLATARTLAPLSEPAARLLTGPRAPAVLLRRDPAHGPGTPLADAVCPGSPDIAVLLPYTPVHRLLFALPGDPPGPELLVMTSANRSGAPIVTDDTEAQELLDGGLADARLWHDRPVHAPCDDSVVRVRADGTDVPVRRSRGYVPEPLPLPFDVPESLAAGGDLKNVFCLARGRQAWLSQHIGDLGDRATEAALTRAAGHLGALTGIRPRLLAADRHPGYRSTAWAREHARGRPLHLVQHHHAHIASAMADAGLDGSAPVIGIAFDGTGYGDDGAVWGGEALLADYDGYRRLAHLAYVPLPGGDAAVRNPCRMALSHLRAAGLEWDTGLPCVSACTERERRLLAGQLDRQVACVPTSSMGRLFDAVSSLLGLCHRAGHEAQAAVALEACAAPAMTGCGQPYAFAVRPGEDGGPALVDPAPVLRAAVADLRAGTAAAVVAARFHHAVAAAVVSVCRAAGRSTGVWTVALSGGVFANALLEDACTDALRGSGFTVVRHHRVPCGDGGLALGQVLIASRARERGPSSGDREGAAHVPGSARQGGRH
ncbi:carbamoyltransferase HypF [Streptomyces sp. NPDC026206]|uniref:carbamoyltransferase HypF n=1 Tax=Streptomyces sp. NPDC026206 TaxID=3157089 RepID=UPI0033DA16EE